MTWFVILCTFVVTWSVHGTESSFYQGWRAEQTRRLAQVMPCSSRKLKSRTGVSIHKVAEVLGTSSAFVTMCLHRPDYQLKIDEVRTLSRYLDLEPAYLLVEDYFDRFAGVHQLEHATKDERRLVRELLMQIFMGRSAMQKVASGDENLDFERRRRATVKYRLGLLMPGERETMVSAKRFATTLGLSLAKTERILRLETNLMYEDAVILGRTFGVEPEWILAADLLDDLDRQRLAHVLESETVATRELVLGLWDRRHACKTDLVPAFLGQ